MAQCYTCSKALVGSWNMTVCGNTYDKTGRYLGISDGYFLYDGNPNWVYCYCHSCWKKQILLLPIIPKDQQLQVSQLQQELTATNAELTALKNQLNEMTEKYQKVVNPSGIDKWQDLLKQLNASQIETLHNYTNFRVDTFETTYNQQQIQCSTQFVRSSSTQLQSSVDAVTQLQKTALTKAKQAKETVLQTLTTAGLAKTTIDASIIPLDTEINQIEKNIEEWNTFSTILTNTINNLPIPEP